MSKSGIYLHLARVVLIAILSLLIVHFLSYKVMPWHDGYQFPSKSYLIIFSFGFLICTINWIVYTQIHFEKIKGNFRRFMMLVAMNICVTIISYSILFPLINIVILGYTFSSVIFLKYLFVVMLIIIIEFSMIIIYKMVYQAYSKTLKKFFIDTGSTQLMVDPSEILCFRSNAKMIKVFLKSEKSYYTQYTSLDDVARSLSEHPFFRINRQYIVNKEAIESVKKDGDRRFLVNLQQAPKELSNESITVSRYRSKDFAAWFTNQNLTLAN